MGLFAVRSAKSVAAVIYKNFCKECLYKILKFWASLVPGLSAGKTDFKPKQVLAKFVLENVAFVRFFFG